MGKRGPQPKSSEIKKMEGNPGNRDPEDFSPREDLSTGGLFIPTSLRREEKDVWRYVLASMPSWYFRAADKHLLMTYCRVMCRLQRAERAMMRKPLISKRGNGAECLSPYMKVIEEAETKLVKLSDALGISRNKRFDVAPDRIPVDPESAPRAGEDPDDFGDLVQRPRLAHSA